MQPSRNDGECLDTLRDAAALVLAVHHDDREARDVIMSECDTAEVALALARTLTSVLGERIGCRHCVSETISNWQADLRTAASGI